MRMRDHEHLQFLLVPLVPLVAHPPPLLPRPAVDVQELDLVVQVLGREVDRGAEGGVVDALDAGDRLAGLEGAAVVARGGAEAGGDGLRDAEEEEGEEEEEDGGGEGDGDEVGEDEVDQRRPLPGGLAGRDPLRLGRGGGREEARRRPAHEAARLAEVRGEGHRAVAWCRARERDVGIYETDVIPVGVGGAAAAAAVAEEELAMVPREHVCRAGGSERVWSGLAT